MQRFSDFTEYEESELHFRAELLLSNFSSALGISIRHACFFFAPLLLFLSKQVYCEKCKEKSLSPPSLLPAIFRAVIMQCSLVPQL